MSGRWNDDSLNCDFKSIHCKLDQFEKSLQSVTDDVSEDMIGEKVRKTLPVCIAAIF